MLLMIGIRVAPTELFASFGYRIFSGSTDMKLSMKI